MRNGETGVCLTNFMNISRVVLFCSVIFCCSCSRRITLAENNLPGPHTVRITCERMVDNTAPIYVTLVSERGNINGPVFVGSSSQPQKEKFASFLLEDIIWVTWENTHGERVIIYIYSLSDKLGWPFGREEFTSEQVHDLGSNLLSKVNEKNNSNLMVGEVQ